jgi:hypothetical protein
MQDVLDERHLASELMIVKLAHMAFDGAPLHQHNDQQQGRRQQREEQRQTGGQRPRPRSHVQRAAGISST